MLRQEMESEHGTEVAVLLITCPLWLALMDSSRLPRPAKVPLPFLPPFLLEGERRGCF